MHNPNCQNDYRSLSTINQPISFFSSNFPESIELNLNDDDVIAGESFKELFTKAQQAGLPYYLISVVQLTGNVNKIYDTIFMRGWLTALSDKKFLPIDPQTRLDIEKIYYFALDCLDQNCDPITPLDQYKLHFHNYFDPKIYDSEGNDENLAIDALDYVTILEGSSEQKIKVNRIQTIIMSECFRALEVAKGLVNSIDDILNIDATDNFSFSDDEDMFVEFEKKISSGFLNQDMLIEFEKTLVSSGSFSSSTCELSDSNISIISPIPVAGEFKFGSNESIFNEFENDELDLSYEPEEDETIVRLELEFLKWRRAVNYFQINKSDDELSL